VISALLAFSLTLVAGANESQTGASLDAQLAQLRKVDRVDGCAVGVGGTPGQFFAVASDILKHAALVDYRTMLSDSHPVVRVMGVLGISLQHPESKEATDSLLTDNTKVAWQPFGCDLTNVDVGYVAQALLKDPTVLGLTSTGDVGAPCKRPGRPTKR
jgi:hypothetical protein